MLELVIRLSGGEDVVVLYEERTILREKDDAHIRSHQPSPDLVIATAIRAGMQFGEITTTLRSATCAATFALHVLGRAVRFTRRLGTLYPEWFYWFALREL